MAIQEDDDFGDLDSFIERKAPDPNDPNAVKLDRSAVAEISAATVKGLQGVGQKVAPQPATPVTPVKPAPQPAKPAPQPVNSTPKGATTPERVLVQGAKYNGPDLGEETPRAPAPKPAADANSPSAARRQARAQQARTPKEPKVPSESGGMKSMAVKIGAGVVAILVVAIVVVFLSGKSEEKPKQGSSDDWAAITYTPYVFKYTDAEKTQLRAHGYTGDEIEAFEAQQQDVGQLIQQAKDLMTKTYEETVAPLFDNASEEYLELLDKTWVGQREFDVPADVTNYSYMSTTLNLDYEKVSSAGLQLFIKVHVNDTKAIFMNVKPDRWLQLKDRGNIVLNIKYVQLPNGEQVVTDMVEIIN